MTSTTGCPDPEGTASGLAGAARPDWSELPIGVRAAVEDVLGGRVVTAVTAAGGFSSGVAARLRLESGAEAFVKSVCAGWNEWAYRMHPVEARINEALPDSVPAPRMRWWAEVEGYVTLLFDAVDGQPPVQPWVRAELDEVLVMLDELAEALTPSPLPAVPTFAEQLADDFSGWEPGVLDSPPSWLPEWAAARLPELVEIAADWPTACAGSTLLHCDTRADNLLMTSSGPVVVDWPWACVGAPWLDQLSVLVNASLGGHDPDELFTGTRVGGAAEPAAVDSALAALTGMWLRSGSQADHPQLRAHQRSSALMSFDWLAGRRGWA